MDVYARIFLERPFVSASPLSIPRLKVLVNAASGRLIFSLPPNNNNSSMQLDHSSICQIFCSGEEETDGRIR